MITCPYCGSKKFVAHKTAEKVYRVDLQSGEVEVEYVYAPDVNLIYCEVCDREVKPLNPDGSLSELYGTVLNEVMGVWESS